MNRMRDKAFSVANAMSDIESRINAIHAILTQLPASPDADKMAVIPTNNVEVPVWQLSMLRKYVEEMRRSLA